MTSMEKRKRKRMWLKLIRKWKTEPIDRSYWQISTLEDPAVVSENLAHLSVYERLEHLMRLRWMNYGPDALYGRLERVFAIGELEPAPLPRRRRRGNGSARPGARYR